MKKKVVKSEPCNCELCQFGNKLGSLVIKYQMSEDDSWYLLDTVFGMVEHLNMDVWELKRKIERMELRK